MLLMECLSSTPSPPHVLNYDIRSRNTPMESSREAARDALNTTIAQLKDVVPNTRMADPIVLHAITPYPQVVQTTFGREVPWFHGLRLLPVHLAIQLWFAGLHAVHHWSMVRETMDIMSYIRRSRVLCVCRYESLPENWCA